ncbi:recombinase RecB [Streptomyces sp. NBRC 13847]|nr:recombinase RecB [Streptomyces sp. NBRC 13847]
MVCGVPRPDLLRGPCGYRGVTACQWRAVGFCGMGWSAEQTEAGTRGEPGGPGTDTAGAGAGAAGAAVEAAGPGPQADGAGSGRGEGPRAPVALSPSRAGDFMQCPLLYRFRVIDRLPEKPSPAATRGTVVHAVLERLFDAPAAERTAAGARALVPGEWEKLLAKRPELAGLFADATSDAAADGTAPAAPDGAAAERLATWLAEAEALVERWFTLEDPTRLEPADRELYVETELESGLRLRGIIDRVDVAPTGEVRIVDYKTGKAPRPQFAEGALFQMKFYALVMWRLRGVVPRRLQLVYLGSGDVVTYDPGEADLRGVERKLLALWEAIQRATATGDWRPRPTKLCGWCDHQAHCPEFGGTPPVYPLEVRPPDGAVVPQGRMEQI